MADTDSNATPLSPNPNQDPESGDDSASLMYVRCAVCGEWLDVKPGKLNWVSHGLCPACHASEMVRIGLILEERRRQREQPGGAAGNGAADAAPAP